MAYLIKKVFADVMLTFALGRNGLLGINAVPGTLCRYGEERGNRATKNDVVQESVMSKNIHFNGGYSAVL